MAKLPTASRLAPHWFFVWEFGVALAVRHRLEVTARAEGLDLARELLEEAGDLVETIAVLALDLPQPLLAPRAEALVPVARPSSGPPNTAASTGSVSSGLLIRMRVADPCLAFSVAAGAGCGATVGAVGAGR